MAWLMAIPFVCAGLVVLGIGVSEWYEERRFLKRAIKTTGIIVDVEEATHDMLHVSSRKNHADAATGTLYAEKAQTEDELVFAIVEYMDYNGDIHRVRSRKTYDRIENREVEICYDPADPSDAMVDCFYKVGNSKYYRIAGGLVYMAVLCAWLITH